MTLNRNTAPGDGRAGDGRQGDLLNDVVIPIIAQQTLDDKAWTRVLIPVEGLRDWIQAQAAGERDGD